MLLIAIPIYNNQDFFIDTCCSISFQLKNHQKKNILVLISDNCSDCDFKVAIDHLELHKIQHHYVRHKKNIGKIENIQFCVEYAIKNRFKHMTFLLNGDQLVDVKNLFESLAVFSKVPSTKIVFSPFQIVIAQKKFNVRFYEQKLKVLQFGVFRRNSELFGRFVLAPIQGIIFKVEDVSLNFTNRRYLYDYEAIRSCVLDNSVVAIYPKPFVLIDVERRLGYKNYPFFISEAKMIWGIFEYGKFVKCYLTLLSIVKVVFRFTRRVYSDFASRLKKKRG